jgi:perosamine synthetase
MQSGRGAPQSGSLAIHGGPRKVGGRLPLLVQRLGYGLQRCWDLRGALPLMVRGITTIADGSESVALLEDDFRELTGAGHALAMTNGTACLHSAYFALGVKPGTEVIVPSYTWHATATPILLCGAVPVFCEIDPRTLTLDPDDVERRITERTRVITAVHIWGNPAPMDRIREIADRHGIAVVEDCSHAHGALFRGQPVGSWGDVGCFSLQAAKTVEGGECGVAVTDDPTLYDRMLLLGHNGRLIHGQKAASFRVGNTSLGLKYRPHLVATVLGHASARRLSSRNRAATATWDLLCQELANQPALRPIQTTEGGTRGGYYAFVFEYRGAELGGPSTAEFVEAVAAEGAPLQRDQYLGALPHQTPLFRDLDRRELGGVFHDPTRPWDENRSTGVLPTTEAMSERLVRLPPELRGVSRRYVRRCAAAMKKVLAATVPQAAEAPVARADSRLQAAR